MNIENIIRLEARLKFLREHREAFEYRIAEARKIEAVYSEKLYSINESIAEAERRLAQMKARV